MTRTPWPPPSRPTPTHRPPPPGPTQAEVGAIVQRFNAGRFAEAEALVRPLTQRFPSHGFGWKVLGAALKQQGRLVEAIEPMGRAVDLARNDPEAHNNLGIVLLQLGRYAEAAGILRRAVELKSDYAAAHSNLGAVLLGLGRATEAEGAYRRTVELAPDYAEAHNNLGIALLDQNRFAEAAGSLRRALALAPDYTTGHSTLGAILGDQAMADASAAAYGRAAALEPRSLQHAIRARLVLPIIEESPATIDASRQRYRRGIAALESVAPAPLGETESLNTRSFFLAYHDRDDRPIMEEMGRAFRAKVPNLSFASPHLAAWRPPGEAGRKIRVGFLSKYFSLHTIGRLFGGFVRGLDRERFEVVLLHTNRSRDDDFRRDLDAAADRTVVLPAALSDQHRAIAAEALDVLLYPDIGMSASTYFLAHARLAPVQALSFGHPDTTGLETMDYFVSGAPMEPDDAEAHYSERLIRLNRLPSFYPAPVLPAPLPGRAALGLPEGATLYGCPQSLFKLHPDFDPVLAAIAAGDPNGRIVLIEGSDPIWSATLKARWRATHPVLLERTLFLPHLSPADFLGLMAEIDVGLDPIHFGGGNTFYEAAVFGQPVVAWPGRFMRGRITAGAYRQMGLAEAPVVSRIEDFAPTALALGKDSERRKALRHAIVAAAHRELFEDRQAVGDLEAFLEAAVAAAGRGERLPVGWRPPADGTV